jgi:hypothetical protein
MKRITIIILSIIFLSDLSAQTTPESLTFSEVIKVDSVSKQELYSRAKEWFFKTYRSSKDVVANEDKEGGVILGDGSIFYDGGLEGQSITGYVSYKISISVKDGKYKYEISDFIHKSSNTYKYGDYSMGRLTTAENFKDSGFGKSWYNKYWKEVKLTVQKSIDKIMPSLKAAMSKPSLQKQDW